jgi:DNA topoisomerase-1
MNQIQQGTQTKQNVLQNATETLSLVTSELKEKEAAIGAQLSQIIQKTRYDDKTIGACPKCPDGKLVVLRSKRTRKRFVGCTNYFEGKCNAAFPLPQTGIVKPLTGVCGTCGSPIITLYLRGRRAWKLCLNPDCPQKGVRGK